MRQNTELTSGIILLQKVNKIKIKQSRKLRKEMTPAESHLWTHLRNNKLCGLKFRRQQIIEGFIVDFFCHSLKLVIEVDGEIHNTDKQKILDTHRKDVFEARGLTEIRFTNNEVLHNTNNVLEKIRHIFKEK